MSTYYEFTMAIMDFDSHRIGEIQEAAGIYWDFDLASWRYQPEGPVNSFDWDDDSRVQHATNCLSGFGQRSLSGLPVDRAREIAHTVWEANGSFCGIRIRTINLESPDDREWFYFGPKDYVEYEVEVGADETRKRIRSIAELTCAILNDAEAVENRAGNYFEAGSYSQAELKGILDSARRAERVAKILRSLAASTKEQGRQGEEQKVGA